MKRRPPSSTRTDTLFPYTTLFRSPLVGVAEAVQEMHLLEGLRAVVPMRLVDRLGVRQAGSLEGGVDDLPGGHLEARMRRAEPPGEAAKDLLEIGRAHV